MKTVLIVKLDSIGDFIIFTAVIEEYAKLYKGCKIDFLCRPYVKELFEPIPFINKIMTLDITKMDSRRYVLYKWCGLMRMKFLTYDTVIYSVCTRIRVVDQLISQIQSPEKIALEEASQTDPDQQQSSKKIYSRLIAAHPAETEMANNISFVNALGGAAPLEAMPRMWFKEDDQDVYQSLAGAYSLSPYGYFAIAPGAGYPIRYWDNNKWADLILRLRSRFPHKKVALLGGPGDMKLIESILRLLPAEEQAVVNLCDRSNLRVLAKIIGNAFLLIGTESSAVHIAAAVRVKSICIVGGGHFGRFYPYGDKKDNRIVFKRLDCYYCNWICKYPEVKCLNEIEVDEVWKELDLLISQDSGFKPSPLREDGP